MAAKELYSLSLLNDANLIAYYRMEDNANDYKNTHNGTATNITYNTAAGKFNKGADSTGSDSGINCGNAINLTGNFSISFWIKMDTLPSAFSTIITKELAGYSLSPLSIYTADSNGKVHFFVRNNLSTGSPSTEVVSNNALSTSEFQNWVFTRDGTNINIYFNGEFDNSAAWTNTQGSDTTNPFAIFGGYSGSNFNNCINGRMDDIAIFTRALTATEIANIYNSRDSVKTNWFL